MQPQITVSVLIHAPIEKVWEYWTNPEHITKWCFASDDWCAPSATNDLKTDGTFTTRMESKDGKIGFDLGGTYTNVIPLEKIEYKLGDERKVSISFSKNGDTCEIIESFDPEKLNPREMQQAGWQAILENFKNYTEK